MKRLTMKKLTAHLLVAWFAIFVSQVSADDHQENISPAASTGQIVLVYHWPCADLNRGLSVLRDMIAYESVNSPHKYSAVPAVHEDGALASIDVHGSQKSMDLAIVWQEKDETWQSYLSEMASACGSVDDLTVKALEIN